MSETLDRKQDLTTSYDSPLGTMTLASDGDALTGLWFDGQKYFGSTLLPHSLPCPDLPIFNQTRRWLDCYFKGFQPTGLPALKMRGSIFQQRVWQALLNIPYGQTRTYKDIAQILVRQYEIPAMSPQAVGGAIGHNPISIIIPCHRVIAADASLTGYAGGLHRKTCLLHLETTGKIQVTANPQPSR